MVSHQGGIYEGGLSSGCSLLRWFLIRVVFLMVVSHQVGLYEGVLSSGWYL